MIETWTWQIPVGLFGGTVSFLAVLVPAIIIQYYAYGRVSLARLLGTAALSIYAVALVAYTLLPEQSVCDGRSGGILQVIPGAVIADIGRSGGDHGLSSTLAVATIAQPILNIAPFIPLGVLVRVMTGRGYRVVDVDDLITDTGGIRRLLGSALDAAFIVVVPALLHTAVAAVTLGTMAVVLFVDRRGLSGLISGAEMVDRTARGRQSGAGS